MGGIDKRLDQIEQRLEGVVGTLELPSGETVTYGPGELVDAFIAIIDEQPHWLLPYIRRMDPATSALANLFQALADEEDEACL